MQKGIKFNKQGIEYRLWFDKFILYKWCFVNFATDFSDLLIFCSNLGPRDVICMGLGDMSMGEAEEVSSAVDANKWGLAIAKPHL